MTRWPCCDYRTEGRHFRWLLGAISRRLSVRVCTKLPPDCSGEAGALSRIGQLLTFLHLGCALDHLAGADIQTSRRSEGRVSA